MSLLEIIVAIATSVAGTIIYATVGGGYRRLFGQQIYITEPQENGFLAPAESRRGTSAHAVSGTLKHLPKGHAVWLIVIDEKKGKHWPQGFERVEYHEATGTWSGYITADGWHQVTVTAVVAPPTTQEYFNYFQRVGGMTKHEPLLSIPSECKRRHSIHVKVPPTQPKQGS
ncbi:MAG TPA: hypothetical protein VHW09_27130 [Bryobacteraceae bacterium]|nr:hypothetical protein [Bryobacteraceae bacterium]